MKNAMKTRMFLGLLLSSQFSMAGGIVPLGVPLGGGQGLPLELGGIAGVAALTLIIATQLIKRRK
jgi:hypothetical protein